MAIIDPEGLFEGERLAACSDIAQLYWQRLFLASNTLARLELSYPSIISKVFKTFRKVPTQAELWGIFEEFEKNFLAILYQSDGIWWCQFITSEKFLPKFKKARDTQTPGPTQEMLEQHRQGYLVWRKRNSFSNQSFRNSSEDFQRRGIGVGIGEERKVEKKEPQAASPQFNLPSWIPKDSWDGFWEMRKKNRHKFTERARDLIIKRLDSMRAEGMDPGKVLDQATERGYRGVFPLDEERRRVASIPPNNSPTAALGQNPDSGKWDDAEQVAIIRRKQAAGEKVNPTLADYADRWERSQKAKQAMEEQISQQRKAQA